MDITNKEGRQKFVLLMKDRRNQIRPRRAVLHSDGSIVWKKRLYYYSDKALMYYPTKPNLYGLTSGLLPAHLVREDNSIPAHMNGKGIITQANGMPDIVPSNPYEFESSDIAHKFKESNVIGGLAIAARKSQEGDMTQKYMMYGIAAILVSVIIGLAVIINGMGLLKLW